ncbi:MAG: FecR domain-containing protein [Planctomycetes bacterium]|nr:FecR domain-containing protein [Planctomycetota bacterium]
MSEPLFEELDALLEAMRDGRIEDAQVARLDQLLAEHPEALERFVDRARLQADLEFKLGRRPAAAVPGPRRRAGWKPLAALGAAAALLLAFFALPGAEHPPAQSYEGCAVLTRALDARWEGSPTAPGSVLPKRRLALSSGSIQVEFFSGARVILEGPADFELVSANEGFCRHGKLRAFVPPQAQGFTIRSAAIRLVDRGTEFGLRVDRNGEAEVHVFQGRVELHSTGASQDLAVGRAVRIDPAGAARSIDADPEAFLTLSELNLRSAEEAKGRYERWGASSDRLRRDPRIAVYYSFEDAPAWSRELRCQRAERSPLDGAIIGARWTEGRWLGKKALEFKCPGDRVRFQDAGEYESLTLMTWVRVDGLDRPFSGLMLTDGWTSGSVHWQITEKGLLRLGIHGEKQAFDYDTALVFEPAQFGRWVHLCTVYDRPGREVLHYVDGRLVRRIPLRFDTLLRLGNVELGNWGVPLQGTSYAIRHLNGRMDEFALFGQALREEEVRELHQVGAPAP